MSINYEKLGIKDKMKLLFTIRHVDPQSCEYKINADFLRMNVVDECQRELMVSYLPMLPLLEKTVYYKDADYILYAHCYARIKDMSNAVVRDLKYIDEVRKKGAEIIVVGKSANAEKLLNGQIDNITFVGDHFTEYLGKRFGFDIKEQYLVYDDVDCELNIWPVDGCLKKCAFCRRTYMDIKFESLSLEYIKKQLDYYKENDPDKLRKINLRAENLTEYGLDIYGCQMLHELINLVSSYPEVQEIHFPIGLAISEINEEILNALCNSPKIKHLALNLETGSDRLLKLINKGHTKEKALYVYKKIREAHPDVTISSIVMVGLPTEGLDDILQLADLICETAPNFVRCNYYGLAPGHPLAQYPQLADKVKEYHLKMLVKFIKDRDKKVDMRLSFPTIYKNSRLHNKRKAEIENTQCDRREENYYQQRIYFYSDKDKKPFKTILPR